MKWTVSIIKVALVSFLMTNCTITVKPIPQKSSVHSTRHSTHRLNPASKIKQSNEPNVKETWWIENYHKLESAKGNYVIRADEDIEPLPNGKFRVPDAVLTHYQDLLLSPKPSATPIY